MIAGGGFAMMAWAEAQRRTFKGFSRPAERRNLVRPLNHQTPSVEYYRIIDQATLRAKIYYETVKRTGHQYAARWEL